MNQKGKPSINRRKLRAERNKFLDVKQSASLRIIKGMEERKLNDLFEERSQGFWIQDEIRSQLQKITRGERKLKTQQIQWSDQQISQVRRQKKKTTLKNYRSKDQKNLYQQEYYDTILPQLKQHIKNKQKRDRQNQYQQNEITFTIKKRRKILHLLIFSLYRYKMRRLYEALDILLIVSAYFQKNDEQSQLKELCLGFIYKLHKEIEVYNKTQGYFKRKKRSARRKSKSLTVLRFISQQKFMENFIQNLRKSKLIHESSFKKFLKGGKKAGRINAKCNIKIPTPQELFNEQTQNQIPTNYNYVAIVADEKTNSFPYSYPKSLTDHITQSEYRQIICKLNSLLYPQSKNYTFENLVKIYFIPFILIFFVMLLFTLLSSIIERGSFFARIVSLLTSISILLILGLTVNSEEQGFTNLIQIKIKMEQYLDSYEKLFKTRNIKFKMTQKADAFFIIFLQEQSQEESSSNSELAEIIEEEYQFTESKVQSIKNRTIASHEKSQKIGHSQSQNKQNGIDLFEISTPTHIKKNSTAKNSSYFYRTMANNKNSSFTPKKQNNIIQDGDFGHERRQSKNNCEISSVKFITRNQKRIDKMFEEEKQEDYQCQQKGQQDDGNGLFFPPLRDNNGK